MELSFDRLRFFLFSPNFRSHLNYELIKGSVSCSLGLVRSSSGDISWVQGRDVPLLALSKEMNLG
jgi:hypothetical protein